MCVCHCEVFFFRYLVVYEFSGGDLVDSLPPAASRGLSWYQDQRKNLERVRCATVFIRCGRGWCTSFPAETWLTVVRRLQVITFAPCDQDFSNSMPLTMEIPRTPQESSLG